MSHVAVALARQAGVWDGDEVDLGDVEDLDGVIEAVQEVVGDEGEPTVLFVEEDDEWFVVLRLDVDGEPRVFVSDARVFDTSTTAGLFAEAAIDVSARHDPSAADDPDLTEDSDGSDGTSADESADDDEEQGTRVDGDPAGDADLLADLGVPGARLLALNATEGQLPWDVITAVSETIGCHDVLERLRGA